MSRAPDLRQLKVEDFDKKDQNLVAKLAFPFNNFMQQVIACLNKGIDLNNLNQQTNSFSVSVNAAGTPVSTVSFQNNLSTKPLGITCIKAVNNTSSTRFPSSTPFISYTINESLITVTNIAGLPIPTGQTNSDNYTLTILIVGSNLPTA